MSKQMKIKIYYVEFCQYDWEWSYKVMINNTCFTSKDEVDKLYNDFITFKKEYDSYPWKDRRKVKFDFIDKYNLDVDLEMDFDVDIIESNLVDTFEEMGKPNAI